MAKYTDTEYGYAATLCMDSKIRNCDNVTRQVFCRDHSWITEHTIRKVYKTFKRFKEVFNAVRLGYTQAEKEQQPPLKLKHDTSVAEQTSEAKECKYLYNNETRDYIFDFTNIANIGNIITLKDTQVYAILQDYSNFDKSPKTINTIALKHKIPAFVLKKILQALSITHDSLPITEELIKEESSEKIVDDLMQIRKFNIFEKFNHQAWKDIQANSDKWIQFETGVLNPVSAILEHYKPIEKTFKYNRALKPATEIDYSKTYVVTLSDWHFGCYGDQNNMFYADKDWTIEETLQNVDKYLQQIAEDLDGRVSIPGKVCILSVGDILDSLSGFTTHGTKLNTNPKGATQFQIALEALDYFLQSLIEMFPKDTGFALKAVSGNHDAIGDYVLFNTIKHIYKGKIDCEIATTRWLMFQIESNIFVVEHGYAAAYPSKVPNTDIAKENYIQKLMLEKMSEFKLPVKNRYFIMGDRHHYSQKVMSSFEFIQLPTWVKNDEYADNMNLNSRPRQITLLIDDNKGIEQTINHYFD